MMAIWRSNASAHERRITFENWGLGLWAGGSIAFGRERRKFCSEEVAGHRMSEYCPELT